MPVCTCSGTGVVVGVSVGVGVPLSVTVDEAEGLAPSDSDGVGVAVPLAVMLPDGVCESEIVGVWLAERVDVRVAVGVATYVLGLGRVTFAAAQEL